MHSILTNASVLLIPSFAAVIPLQEKSSSITVVDYSVIDYSKLPLGFNPTWLHTPQDSAVHLKPRPPGQTNLDLHPFHHFLSIRSVQL